MDFETLLGAAGPDAPAPPGATLPDSSPIARSPAMGPRWKPSEIPSKTQSVSAFLPGRVSAGLRSSGEVRSGSYRTEITQRSLLASWRAATSKILLCGWRRPWAGRPQRGPYTGRGVRPAGLVGDRTRREFTM